MSKQKNPVWRFLASVKLALALLIILATTSIIGTLIKQGQAPEFYLTEYGEANFRLFEALQLTRMYSSWWYIALLALFALNLLVCSIERLPAVWRIMTQDNLLNPPQNLENLGCSSRQVSKRDPHDAAKQISQTLEKSGWKKICQRVDGDSMLLFTQKGAWSRLGVYVVHFSILIVLTGAILGGLFGFQASVIIPEGRATKQIYKRYTNEPYPLGFSLRCNQVEKSYYPNGMIKQYHSDLTVLDPEKPAPYQKTIIVNDPLSYQGLTFYQGDAHPTQEYFVEIINRSNGMRQAFRIPPEQEINWSEAGLWLQVKELKLDQEGNASQGEIALRDDSGTVTAAVWISDKTNRMINVSGQNLDIYFRQMHATLLLISKDPGVSTVYAGCIIMMVGLAVSFFFSHQRIWVAISPDKKGQSVIIVGGNSNKNKFAFEEAFHKLVEQLDAQASAS